MKLLRTFFPVLLLLLIMSCNMSVQAADDYPKLEITKLPNKLVYCLGEKFDKTGLEATLLDTANTGTRYDAADLSVTTYPFNTSGEITITVKAQHYETGSWYSTTLTVYVMPYTWTLQNSSDYPRHLGYGEDLTKDKSLKTYSVPGSAALLLQFSARTSTDCCDYIYLADGSGNLLGCYEDDELSGQKIWITGDSFSIWITSDEDDCCYSKDEGYSFDNIWAVDVTSCSHLYGEEIITPATCDRDGSRVKECVGCGYVAETVLPKLTSDGQHTYDYEQYPKETYVSGYSSYYNLYYVCETCGHKNIASGYPGFSGDDADHGRCGQTIRWALLDDGTMVLFRSPENMSYYTMYSVPEKATQAKKLYVQDQITTIYPEAFQNAYNLTAVRLPDSLEKIGDSAFYNCTKLTEISFPSALTSIGKNAFRLCTGLTSVDFGTSSPSVMEYAFAYCDALKDIDFGTGAVTLDSSVFDECPAIKELDIPVGVTLGTYTFHKCIGLETVTVRCKVIPDSTFESCWSLSAVTLENTESIGEYAFGGTNSLKSIVFPVTLRTIDRAFTVQANHYPALRTATFLAKDTAFDEHPFPGISTTQLTIRGPGCSTAAAFAKKHGYAFSATDNSTHTMLTVPAVTPTCLVEGFTEGANCTICGYVEKTRTSLGYKAHEMTAWESTGAEAHSRRCTQCATQNETAAHERVLGLCDICKDDNFSCVFNNGALIMECPQGIAEELVVIAAVYNNDGKMLRCATKVWSSGADCEVELSLPEEAAYICVFLLHENVPQRLQLNVPCSA